MFNPLHDKKLITETDSWDKVVTYFNNHNGNVVIKPIDGSNGIDVFLCKDIHNLEDIILNTFGSSYGFILCPYYESIAEYRTIYLNGNCLLTYQKIKPFVIGDGIQSIEELIYESYSLDKKKLEETMENLDLKYIPKKNEKYEVSWKHNLSGGAGSEIIPDGDLKDRIEKIVKKAGQGLNINFASIDIIHGVDDRLYVMEVNSNVYMDKFLKQDSNRYKIVKEIYSKAIDATFED